MFILGFVLPVVFILKHSNTKTLPIFSFSFSTSEKLSPFLLQTKIFRNSSLWGDRLSSWHRGRPKVHVTFSINSGTRSPAFRISFSDMARISSWTKLNHIIVRSEAQSTVIITCLLLWIFFIGFCFVQKTSYCADFDKYHA